MTALRAESVALDAVEYPEGSASVNAPLMEYARAHGTPVPDPAWPAPGGPRPGPPVRAG